MKSSPAPVVPSRHQTAAADRHGLSFYSDGATATLLRLPVQAVTQARDELLARDLLAYEPPLTQVLSLPALPTRRPTAPGQGLLRLGDLFREVAASSTSDATRSQP